ncbi:anti-sigma factor family protein [Rhizobium leguminosarum]|uniref:anti-sigma factor family protein n=1 Tax=Rhizobium leguminosarum TaxID=384 RepID=UPI0004851948|nr:anti-sigma factor [Rhizobium leguminosarum]
MRKKPITEDDLQAYVDDALDADRRQEVADYLSENPDAAIRIASYERHAAVLRLALEPVTKEPVPSRLNLTNIASAKCPTYYRNNLRMAAAAVMLASIGATGGWLAREYSLPSTEGVGALAQEASASFETFAGDKVRPVEVRADGSESFAQFASETLGAATIIPDLSNSGYRLMGGRVISTVHGPGIMTMYDNDRGSRLVVMTRKMIVDQNKPMVGSSHGSNSGWTWANNGMGFSVVGQLPREDLHRIADSVRAQVTAI